MNSEKAFSKIVYIPFDSSSPARVNRMTGELQINTKMWDSIPDAHKVFILLHEYAHLYLDTSNELAVDKQAHEWYIQMGYPLTESVKSLTTLLDTKNKSHIQRAYAQYVRSKNIDKQLNQNNMCDCEEDVNEAIYEELKGRRRRKPNKKRQIQTLQRQVMEMQRNNPNMSIDNTGNIYENTQPGMSSIDVSRAKFQNPGTGVLNLAQQYQTSPGIMLMEAEPYPSNGGPLYNTIADPMNDEDYPPVGVNYGEQDMFDRFFADYSGCQPGETAKDCRKRIKVESKAQAKISRAEGSRLKNEAKATLAEQGISSSSGADKAKDLIKDGLGAAQNILGSVFGGGGGAAGGGSTPPSGAPDDKKDNTMLYMGLGIAFVIGLIIYFKKK